MKTRCANCRKKYDDRESFCPHCGAYISETRDYTTHPGPPDSGSWYAAPRQAASRRKNRMTIATVSALLSLASIAVGLLTWMGRPDARIAGSGGERAASQTAENDAARSVSELYIHLDEYPHDYEAVSELVAALCGKGQTGEAAEVLLRLYRGACDDAGCYRRAGEALLSAGSEPWAVRAFLTAHRYSGLQSDLDLATRCGTPADIIDIGPTSQALEFFFEKPFSLITWEEVGRIRYMSLQSSGDVDFSLTDPGECDELEFAGTVRSFAVDDGTVSASFLYGLRELRFAQSVNMEDLQLCALTDLRRLHLYKVYQAGDLQAFSTLPSLESLHVGGSSIATLEGLENLPNLTALGLESTSIENLSLLASYRNIESLALTRNENLTGLGSLVQMDHLKYLAVERQDIMDFQFLASLTQIEGLTLVKTGIKDFYFISELAELRQLKLSGNDDLRSVAGIGALTNMEDLYISGAIDGIEEIGGLTGIRKLHLQGAKSLGTVRGLENLEQLSIGGAQFDSLEPISGLPNLRSFSIVPTFPGTGAGQHYYFSLEPLATLPSLTRVSLSDASFYGSSAALFRIPTLEYLDLTRSEADVGAGLSGLTGIRTLRMTKFRALSNVDVWSDGFFTNIDYDRPEMDQVAATLAGLEHLEYLELSQTGLTDIAFLRDLPALQTAHLADNYITDIAVLPESASLRYVGLSGNPVRDWAPADEAAGVVVSRG